MHNLKNHPGMWLNDSAGPAFDAYEDKYGVIQLSDAGRTEAKQQSYIDRWDQGGVYNRPPYLYNPARPAKTSPHVRNGGEAVDTPEFAKFRQHCEEFGFRWYGSGDPVHFNHIGGGSAGGGQATQVTRDRQNWLNHSRNAGLTVDGIEGPKTKEAYKAYQTFLKAYGYAGAVDGIWGGGTQAAHEKYYADFNKPAPGVSPSAGVPTGLKWHGVQKMLKRYYSYAGNIDGIPGSGTIGALQRFLTDHGYQPGAIDSQWGGNTAKGVQRWLKDRYQYSGAIDGIFGDGSRAAWARAEAANDKAF